MRLGPILVPLTIVVAIGVIVAAQSDWFDGGSSEPTFSVHAGASQAAPSTSDQTAMSAAGLESPATSLPTAVAQDPEPTAIVGRSVGKTADGTRQTLTGYALGTGGASLDADGDGAPAVSPDRAAASAPDALQQARDEAAKAKQDVLDVTQASISAQHASEAEFERQKAELNDQIAQMRTKLDAASAQPTGSAATAEAKTATAMAELSDARERENALRATLSAAQAAGPTDAARKEAADKLAAAEHARIAAQDRASQLESQVAFLQAGIAAGRMANDKLAMAERTIAEAQARAKTSVDKVAALEAELATKAAAEHALADTQARAKDLSSKVEALQAELTANKSAASLVVSRADAADRLKSDLDAARQREDALKGQVAALQDGAAEAARAQGAETTAVRKASALQQQLESSRLREQALDVKLAALQAGATDAEARAKQAQASASQAAALRQQLAASEDREKDLGIKLAALQQDARAGNSAKAPDPQALTSLQADLAGARRGEDTLRRENSVLQRELTSQRTANKLLADKLAALQVGMGQPAPPEEIYRHGRAETASRTSDHERLVRELSALRREQMHQELQGLRVEAANLNHSRRGRRSQAIREPDRNARNETVQTAPDMRLPPAEGRAARRRDRQLLRAREAATGPQPVDRAPGRFSALQTPGGNHDDSRATIAQAKTLIRSGNIDQAREVLRSRGGAAATRALADTYNPLTNTQYGAIGVDSDADKAVFLYEQASHSRR